MVSYLRTREERLERILKECEELLATLLLVTNQSQTPPIQRMIESIAETLVEEDFSKMWGTVPLPRHYTRAVDTAATSDKGLAYVTAEPNAEQSTKPAANTD